MAPYFLFFPSISLEHCMLLHDLYGSNILSPTCTLSLEHDSLPRPLSVGSEGFAAAVNSTALTLSCPARCLYVAGPHVNTCSASPEMGKVSSKVLALICWPASHVQGCLSSPMLARAHQHHRLFCFCHICRCGLILGCFNAHFPGQQRGRWTL